MKTPLSWKNTAFEQKDKEVTDHPRVVDQVYLSLVMGCGLSILRGARVSGKATGPRASMTGNVG